MNIWKYYNPKLYLQKLVQFEDEKRFMGKSLYETKPLKWTPERKKSPFTVGSLLEKITP